VSRGEFTDLMGRATCKNTPSKPRPRARDEQSAGLLFWRERFRQHTSRCRHEECGESSGSTTRTPYRRPVSTRKQHGGPAGQVNGPGSMCDRTKQAPHVRRPSSKGHVHGLARQDAPALATHLLPFPALACSAAL
jgi:hypothetical protein